MIFPQAQFGSNVSQITLSLKVIGVHNTGNEPNVLLNGGIWGNKQENDDY